MPKKSVNHQAPTNRFHGCHHARTPAIGPAACFTKATLAHMSCSGGHLPPAGAAASHGQAACFTRGTLAHNRKRCMLHESCSGTQPAEMQASQELLWHSAGRDGVWAVAQALQPALHAAQPARVACSRHSVSAPPAASLRSCMTCRAGAQLHLAAALQRAAPHEHALCRSCTCKSMRQRQ